MILIEIYDLTTLLLILVGTCLGCFALVNWLVGKVFEDV